MKTRLFKYAVLLVAAVLLSAHFWSCSKEDVPEPIPPAVAVTGVTLDKTSISLLVGDSETLTATVTPADAENQKLTWSSDKPAVATVDDNGKVTAVKAGEATVTVTTRDGGKTATCRVTVSDREIKVTEITLAALAIYVGESKSITATVKPDDATNKELTWTSSDETVATVDATGKVTTTDKTGTVTITATSVADPAKKGTCTIKVSADQTDIGYGEYGPEENW